MRVAAGTLVQEVVLNNVNWSAVITAAIVAAIFTASAIGGMYPYEQKVSPEEWQQYGATADQG